MQVKPSPWKWPWWPTPWYTKVSALTLLVLVVLAPWPLFFESRFFISADCFEALLGPAVAWGLFVAGTSVASVEHAKRHPRPEFQKSLDAWVGSPRIYTRVLGPAFLAWAAGWMFTMMVPHLMNMLVGTPFAATFKVDAKVMERSRRSECNRVFLVELEQDWNGRVCVQQRDFDSIQPGQQLRLSGTRSWFGTEVQRYDLVQDKGRPEGARGPAGPSR